MERLKGPFEGRRRWRAREPKKERPAGTRVLTIAASLRALIILMFGVLLIQLINLQVIRGEEFKEQSEINAIREVPVPAARGLIFDRNGLQLVDNSATFSAAIVPGDLPDRGKAAVYRTLSEILGVSVAEIEERVVESIEIQGEYSPAVIKSNLDHDTALILMELEPHSPGMRVLVEPSRNYLSGDLLSHIMGYVGPINAEEYAELSEEGYLYQDHLGKTGVEYSYEDVLRGNAGSKLVEVDAAGRELKVISERRPIDGQNVVLTIDLKLQQDVTNILQQYVDQGENAAAAVMDIRTGELLALQSLPTYDGNVFSGAISQDELDALINDPARPLVNHAISERYAPGSTFKTIVAAGALQEGVATPDTKITSSSYITVENEFDPNVVYVYPDWAPLGELDLYGGLAMSSNVYFYYLAGGKADEDFGGLGEERLARYARAFGLGEPTGIDIPGETGGLVPDARWKQEQIGEVWSLGDTYNFGIGQGYLATTPIQMLDVAAAIANGGELLEPRVVKEFQDSLGNTLEPLGTSIRDDVTVDANHLAVIRQAMRQSVTDGVARNANATRAQVAGKTGTAEFGDIATNDESLDTHGWFIGFAPYDDPQIAVVVFVQNGSGGDDASPAAARIFDAYFSLEDPEATPVPTETPDPDAPAPTDEPQPDLPTPDPDSPFTPAPAPINPTPAPTAEPTAAPTPPPSPEPTPEPTPPPTEPPPEPTEPPPEPDPTEAAPAGTSEPVAAIFDRMWRAIS